MPNFQNAKIYRLVCDDPNLVYYGATTKTLSDRLRNHTYPAGQCTSIQLFEVGGVKIELIENFPCDSKEQLNARERYWIENNKCVNQSFPGRTRKEYKEANKELIKQYYQKNKERIREYTEANKEHKREYDKQYRLKKKAMIKDSQTSC